MFRACCAAGNETLAHIEEAMSIGHKEITPSGTFSLEEVECMGACTGAPCDAGELRFLREIDAGEGG